MFENNETGPTIAPNRVQICPAEQVRTPEKTRGQEKMRMGEGMRVGKGGAWEREERGGQVGEGGQGIKMMISKENLLSNFRNQRLNLSYKCCTMSLPCYETIGGEECN